MFALKVIPVDEGLGVILPGEAAVELGIIAGDTLILSRAPGGFRLSPADAEVSRQLEMGRAIMGEHYDTLREMAKS